jgi:hypothetical protein
MKLLTHNMLACHIKGVKNGFPFKIEATKVEERDADYDPGQWDCSRLPAAAAAGSQAALWLCADFLRGIFPKIEWPAFLEGARGVRGVVFAAATVRRCHPPWMTQPPLSRACSWAAQKVCQRR